MKNSLCCLFSAAFVLLACLFPGCDSGEKVVDEVTGNRAVKQYHQSKKKIEKIAEQEARRYQSMEGDEEDEDKE